jgi:serine/threonine protein kinase
MFIQFPAEENVFALKYLLPEPKTKKNFDNESKMLRQFGPRHHNIIKLLGSITWKESNTSEQYYLLFPWANNDLLGFWKERRKPIRDHHTFKWIVDQCCGIIDALRVIHDPKIVNNEGQELFGRHGDIKPENVLWFSKDGKEVLVLSDLGLTAVHREGSRSNVPGMAIPVTPDYRPPECDMEGTVGSISRSFDIWTLGCLFLEFIVWILHGWEGIKTFKKERESPYINGGETDIYFDIMVLQNRAERYAFTIKEKVLEVSTSQ